MPEKKGTRAREERGKLEFLIPSGEMNPPLRAKLSMGVGKSSRETVKPRPLRGGKEMKKRGGGEMPWNRGKLGRKGEDDRLNGVNSAKYLEGRTSTGWAEGKKDGVMGRERLEKKEERKGQKTGGKDTREKGRRKKGQSCMKSVRPHLRVKQNSI